MGPGTKAKAPIVIEVDQTKDIDRLDIDLPRLTPRLHRDYKNLALLDPSKFEHKRQPYRQFSEEEQREIVFLDIDSDNESHRTVMDLAAGADYRAVVGYFVQTIMRDLRAVGGGDVLFGLVISHYVPDFLVKLSDSETWIVETKGREDLNDPRKWERLKQWCEDATEADAGRIYRALFVDEADWKQYRVNSFAEARATYRT